MCGIAGCFFNDNKDFKKNLSYTKKIHSSLKHRGPDDSGIYYDNVKKIILAHNRLSILDLTKKGSQPIKSHNKQKILTYNGEIYNHLKIRKYLANENYKIDWKGNSDAETLVECIDKIGIDKTLKKIYGMFAFALWDSKTSSLYLARDRFGEKPLYYSSDEKNIYFSSEIKEFSNIFKNKIQINENSVNSFLNFNYIPSPYTIYKNVNKVQSGTYCKIIIEKNKIKKKTIVYWKGKFSKYFILKKNKLDHQVKELDQIMKDVVKDSLISDVPIGIFLSGGIDSSLITSVACSVSNKKINTFSLGVKGHEEYNELNEAEKTAIYLNTNHKSFEISENDIIENIENALDAYDEPFADSSQILTYILCKQTKKSAKVILTGDGGDELFGGYNRHILIYYYEKMLSFLKLKPFNSFITEKILKYFLFILNPKILSFAFAYGEDKLKKIRRIAQYKNEIDLYKLLISNNNEISIHSIIKKNFNNSYQPYLPTGNNFLVKLMKADINNYLTDDVLVKTDRVSMNFGLECRAPMLDLRLYNFSNKIPTVSKFRNFKGKYILRELLSLYLPKDNISIKKRGFSFSVNQILKNKEFIDWFQKLTSIEMLKKNKFINYQKVDNLIKDHMSGKGNYSNTIWSIIVLQNWLNKRGFLS